METATNPIVQVIACISLFLVGTINVLSFLKYEKSEGWRKIGNCFMITRNPLLSQYDKRALIAFAIICYALGAGLLASILFL